MARRKREEMSEGKKKVIEGLITEYDIKNAQDIQYALADLLGGTIKGMMEAEMDEHLGYEKNERTNSSNARNGYKSKKVRSQYGEFDVEVPQDRDSSFETKIVPKRNKDISKIDNIIISMYAKGMSTRQISDQVEDIYAFDLYLILFYFQHSYISHQKYIQDFLGNFQN